jgi:hypothetical protein
MQLVNLCVKYKLKGIIEKYFINEKSDHDFNYWF